MYLEDYKLTTKSGCYVNDHKHHNIYYKSGRGKEIECVDITVGYASDYSDVDYTITYTLHDAFETLNREELEKAWEHLPEDTPTADIVVAMLEYVKNELGGYFPDDVGEMLYDRIKEEEYYERDCD